MKKPYITPDSTAVRLRTLQLLTASENEYFKDEGLIQFDPEEFPADEGD